VAEGEQIVSETSPGTSPGLPSSPPPSPSFLRPLRTRAFFHVWLAQLISQSGDFIFEVALIWLVLELTGSVVDIAIIVTGTLLPSVLLGPFLGVYVDRWDRRKILVATNVGEGIVVAILAFLVLSGHDSMALLFGIVLLLGTGGRLVMVATEAYVPSLVPVEDLGPTNSLLSLSGSLNQIVGLSLGGVFVALLGVTLPIEYDAITFFVAALLLSLVPSPKAPSTSPRPASAPSLFRELREGLSFLRQNRFLVELIGIGMIVNFFGNGLSALFAPYASYVLHGGPTVYGLLGAFVAAGSIVGAAVIGKMNTRKSAGRYLFAGGIGIGLSILLVGFATSTPVAFALMLSFGITMAVANLPMLTLLQAKVPDRLRGRVMAAFFSLVVATGPAGPLALGWIAERWSISAAFLLAGIAVTSVLAVGALTMKELRTVEY
jgi:MFS family permease